MQRYDLAVIGASVAGLSAITAYLEHKPDDTVVLINGEDRLPYKRTKLTKHITSGFYKEEFALHPADWYPQHNINLLNGVLATDLDADLHAITLDNGDAVEYGSLIIATGAEPVTLPWPGIYYIRSASDTENVISAVHSANSAAVVGAGVQGIEIAEQISLLDTDVTLIGRDTILLPRWFDSQMSERMNHLLKSNNITVISGNSVTNVTGDGPVHIQLSDGRSVTADMVAAAVGIRPFHPLLPQTEINRYLESDLRNIYIAGDAAGLETYDSYGLWHGAEYSGAVAGKNAAGVKTPFIPVSYRLKCEVFDTFFFSMHYSELLDSDVFENSKNCYLRVFHSGGKSRGALFFSDNRTAAKPFSKRLQKKIQDEHSIEDIRNLFKAEFTS